jgi:alginate O-acetyltransferase complex protein AlgI
VTNLRTVRAFAFALLALVAIDVGLFWLPVYRALLSPDSTTGSFERTLAAVDRAANDPKHDVLVFGDSRIYDGLFTRVADRAAGGLHFINAGIPGTTPRVWSVFSRALDPSGSRFRAIVIPVDTFSDDDGAIGSQDGNDRFADLHYIALHTTPSEDAAIASSIGPIDERTEATIDLSLRAPLVRDDVQAFASDPFARIAALGQPLPDLSAEHAATQSLAGLRADYVTQTLHLPRPTSGEALAHLRRQIFHVARPDISYRFYRFKWLAPIVIRYFRTHTPIIFVRIPARPMHATMPSAPTGVLRAIAQRTGAQLIPQGPYVALERPPNFADAEHLDRAGAIAFSARFGADVAHALRDREFGAFHGPKVAAIASAATASDRVSAPPFAFTIEPARFFNALALGKPIPLISYEFALFVAAVVALTLVLPNETSRRALLLLASWYFYARWNAYYLLVLLALTTLDYAVARGLEASAGTRKRALLAIGVGANLAFLGCTKYAGLNLLVPIGISFHTFQSISYIVDVSRGNARAERNYLNYALYIAFFPQLLAGPIVRAGMFFRELYARRAPTLEHAARGLGEIALGVLKKTAVADRFAPIVDAYWAGGHTGGAPAAWCAALAFGMQIYFDFSGYTDIAIGCARLLGFDFPQNFHRPYLAWSITEFWRRWHMTLSAWLRDYLYIPLGGNRFGAYATYRNLIITMLLGGLWHGANWTFVIWGGYHGVLLAIERALGIGRARGAAPPRGLRRIAASALTFVLVIVGWVFFRAPSPAAAFAGLGQLFAGGAGPLTLDGGDFAIVAIALAVEIVLEARVFARSRRFAFALATLLALQLATYPGTGAPFVYFKF